MELKMEMFMFVSTMVLVTNQLLLFAGKVPN